MNSIRTVPCSDESLIAEIGYGHIYSYARYGDGEFRSILGWRGNNANEHDWTPELQQDLTSALLSRPKYRLATVTRFVGMTYHKWPGDLNTYLDAWEWLTKYDLDFEWYDQEVWADSLIRATDNQEVMSLLRFLRQSNCPPIMIVGPAYLWELVALFPVASHVVTPDINCHYAKTSIKDRIIANVQHPSLVLISASMAAEVLIHELYDALGAENWLIDVGSIWDPFLNRGNRSYWTRMGVPCT